jgi:WD40 repeat protein
LTVYFAAVLPADAAEPDHESPIRPGVWGLDFSPDGEWLAAGMNLQGQGGPVVLWNTSDWSPQFVRFEESGIFHVAFSPDGRLLAYSTRGGKVGLVDVESREVVREFEAHAGGAFCVVFTPDGGSLITSGGDRMIKFWDAATGALQRTLEGHGDIVDGVAISPDGMTLLSGSDDRTARLWDLESGEVQQSFGPRLSIVRRVRFSRDGQFFLISSWDNHARVHEASTGRVFMVIDGGSRSAELAPDNRFLATTGQGSTAHVFRVNFDPATEEQIENTRTLIGRFADDDYNVREAASAEIVKLGLVAEPLLREAMQAEDAEVRLRSRKVREQVRSPAPTAELSGHAADVENVRFSPDGKLLATGCRGGDLKIWSVPEFENVLTLHAPAAR